jgi:hypothetical protein
MATRRQRLALLAVVGGVAVASTACGTSGYQYVKNSEEGAYFKVPDDWELFRIEQGLPEDRPVPDGAFIDGPWRIVFDADEAPDAAHIEDEVPADVVGQAEIGSIRMDIRASVSSVDLRSLALDGQDPIALYEQGSNEVEIVRYEDITTGDGLRGNRVVLNKLVADGTYVTIDQIALVDPGTTTLYRLLVKCSSKCYLENRNEIDAVVDSWQIRKKS